ncbi:hypothetical protein LEP1GSC123_0985 [Leptospira borgpetersenii str. 200701203]|uniref:Uncharacterized protein n=1 Tax=Leptospira borgpetersenii str. 200701203 TaxID=1193007 RepID=M3GJJ2_LEPBO|nr:hypothetical protein LEP1GSC123_0985 [Leptospira borgpetersenii str. 200701203]
MSLTKTSALFGKGIQEIYHKSIVQIKVTFQEPEYHQPWKKKILEFEEESGWS